MSDLERSLLTTIAWFDLFEYPLTAWEARKWHLVIPAQAGIQKENENRGVSFDVFSGSPGSRPGMTIDLERLVKEGKLGQKWGYYFLPGREAIVETRQRRYLLARDKFAKARRVAKWFRYVPFVRLVAVCNTLGYSNAAEESDIDLFIVAASGKIWTVRGLCLLFLKLFHLRPLLVRFGASREERKDKIDLSFFVTEDAMDVSSLTLQHDVSSSTYQVLGDRVDDQKSVMRNTKYVIPQDPYLSYWLTQLMPLWDSGGMYQKLWDANAALRAPLPHAVRYETSPLRAVPSPWYARGIQRLLELAFGGRWIGSALRILQMKKLPVRILALAGTRDGVVISDTVLKFHDIDRRREYRERWLRSLGGQIQNSKLKNQNYKPKLENF